MTPDQPERRQQCILHEEKLVKIEAFMVKMDKWMLGNGDPEKGVLFKLNKVMDYMLDAKVRRTETDKFRRGVLISFIVPIILGILGFGYIRAEVQDNKEEIKTLRNK